MMVIMIMITLLGVDHALAQPTGMQTGLGAPPKDEYLTLQNFTNEA